MDGEGDIISTVPHKLHQLPRHLKIGNIAIQVHPVNSLNIQSHVLFQNLFDACHGWLLSVPAYFKFIYRAITSDAAHLAV